MTNRNVVAFQSMLGIGDCVQQRAIFRELLKTKDVIVESPYVDMYHDLVPLGLEVRYYARVYSPSLEGNRPNFKTPLRRVLPRRITYAPTTIKRCGSILAAQFASAGVQMPPRPDFSLPVPDEWRARAREIKTGGRPLLVFRPPVRNKIWDRPSRLPDLKSYGELFDAIRRDFFVVSVANTATSQEEILDHPPVDLELIKGELDFKSLAGLFAEASLVFSCAGFAPVLAHAVGTPIVVVYGGNESSRTTQAPAAHHSPSLFIEPIKPCDCHDWQHRCDKRIDVREAVPRLKKFAEEHAKMPKPKTLLFGTCWVDSEHRFNCLARWVNLARALNPDADILMVDSNSPMRDRVEVACKAANVTYWSFAENIGHLSRPINGFPRGRDGWGRAFCRGLEWAVGGGYDYVAHVEGDSLFRYPVERIAEKMRACSQHVLTVPVSGTPRREINWAETGLMFFSCAWLKQSEFVRKYDWSNRQVSPTPERIVWDLCGPDLKLADWKALRGDKNQITSENVVELDWVTHCWDRDEVYHAFVLSVLSPPSPPKVMVNFGCGTNRLPGWKNHDSEVDITRRLPYADDSVDLVFAEHVVEHVDWRKAISFFNECHRVLKPGGTIRVAIPSVDQIRREATQDYINFTAKFTGHAFPSLRSALGNILLLHGHETPYTIELLRSIIFYAGFDRVEELQPGKSSVPEFFGVEGHGKVIGEEFNRIETVVAEATK